MEGININVKIVELEYLNVNFKKNYSLK
jgi:hypothetical protein